MTAKFVSEDPVAAIVLADKGRDQGRRPHAATKKSGGQHILQIADALKCK